MTDQFFEHLVKDGWITVGELKKILNKCPDDMMVAGYDGHITYVVCEPKANEPYLLLLHITSS